MDGPGDRVFLSRCHLLFGISAATEFGRAGVPDALDYSRLRQDLSRASDRVECWIRFASGIAQEWLGGFGCLSSLHGNNLVALVLAWTEPTSVATDRQPPDLPIDGQTGIHPHLSALARNAL